MQKHIKMNKVNIMLGGVIFLSLNLIVACSDDDEDIIEEIQEIIEQQQTENEEEQDEEISENEVQTESLALTAFYIDENEIYEMTETAISVKIPYTSDLTSLQIQVSVSQDSTSIYFADKLMSDTIFTANLTIPERLKIVGQNDSIEYLITPCFSNLPVVYINTPDSTAITSKTEWVTGNSVIIGNAGDYNDEFYDANIRGRGNSTWNLEKKPYALKMGSKSSIFGMPKQKRWCLLANYCDKTLLRNALTFELGRQTDYLEWTPSGKHVDVVLNGVLKGNYYFCEQIRVDENRVNITEMESSDTDEESITGGYLLEYDSYYDEVNEFYSSICSYPVMIKEPDEDVLVDEQFEYIQNYINDMETVLSADDMATTKEYQNYLDVNSFADFWIVYSITAAEEWGWPKSCYFYKDRNEVLKAGPLWDFDYYTYNRETTDIHYTPLYYRYLFNDADFVALVKEHWNEYYSRFESLTDYFDEQTEYLEESAEINALLWPNITETVNGDTDLSMSDAWARMRKIFLYRLEVLDNEIATW